MTSLAGPGDAYVQVETDTGGPDFRIRLRGEADISNVEQLATALSDIGVDRHQGVCLDLSELEFLDVAALRQLAIFTMRLRAGGLGVTTVGASPVVRRAMRVLDAQDYLGMA